MKSRPTLAPLVLALFVASAAAQTPAPLQPLPAIDVPSYMGTWYQVLGFPNRFQQCVADTAGDLP
jgi:apolipoprotein D and lipocalin family protein